MFEEKRLHPVTVFFNILQFLKEFALPIIIGLFTFQGKALGIFLLIIGAVFILILPFSIASWYRFTYRVEEDELRIEHGIFIRKKRYISKNRIQSIDLTQSVIHRIFKLVKVKIETASSGEGAEASLKAVSLEEGELLRAELKNTSKELSDFSSEEEQTTYPSDTITTKRLFLAGTTSGSIGVLLALAAVFFSQIEQFIPEDFFDETLKWVVGLSLIFIIGLVSIVLLVLYVLGIAGTMIKYGKFTITKNKDELFITRGLLEKKQITIPLKRIQAVGIEESLLRQPFGFATVFVEVAGGSLEKNEDFSTVLFPILKKDEMEPFFKKYLPGYQVEKKKLRSLPKRALGYYLIRSCIPAIVLTGALFYFLPDFLFLAGIFWLFSLLQGFLKWKDGGYWLEQKRLSLRFRRGIHRTTMRIYHQRLQSVEIKQHPLHKRHRLATIQMSIIGMLGGGTHYTIKELERADANQIFDWYSYRKRADFKR
ncbi:MAG TPA: PH domain-containing protein [Candidatus Avamphibacillus sp.]|nr:PH domain-containing protein [Candidatus Avamphibacillus sp.]